MNPVQVWRNWRQRLELIRSWGLSPTDVVLEVGSGQNPSPRADVLCERFVADSTERNAEPPRVDRPFVVGDIYHLPFRDRSVDFVICTHVLEHLEDPLRAIAELTRVAPRGYVETPSAVWERLHSFPFHRWFITEEEGAMVFRAKPRPVHDAEAREWMDRLFGLRPGLLDFFFQHERELGTVVGILWEGELPARVEGELPTRLEGEAGQARAAREPDGFVQAAETSRAAEMEALRHGVRRHRTPVSPADRLYRSASRRLRRASSPRVSMGAILRCPVCGSPGEGRAAAWACREGHTFDLLREGEVEIPFLVVEAGRGPRVSGPA